MAMDPAGLASDITTGMGFSLPASAEIEAFASGLIDGLAAGIATFGVTPSPHLITGVTGTTIATAISSAAGYPGLSTELSGYCAAFATYVMASSIVTYIGPPPPAVPDWNTGGTISGLVGAALAAVLSTGLGQGAPSVELIAMATAITDHIMANAEVENGMIS